MKSNKLNPSIDEPVFNEPWEAAAFSLVVGLHERGLFTWQEWADVLSAEIASSNGHDSYYTSWTNALENLMKDQAILEEAELEQRKSDWKIAVESTPHGQPIELKTDG